MSCPDWRHLVDRRDAGTGEGPAWVEARAHLAACPRCREEALAADPTLIFHRLQAPAVSPADVAAMKQGVAALIRASRVSAPPASVGTFGGTFHSRPAARGLWRSAPRWARLGAAAALLVAGGLQAPVARELAHRSSLAGGAASAAGAGDGGLLETALPGWGAARPFPAALAATGSTLEDLDLPDARIYEVASEGMQVVMIVDPSLDL